MIEDLKRALGPKKSIDPLEKEAKLNALKGMKKAAGDVMAHGVKDSMNKVTVAAPDKESLEAGLAKAKDLIGHSDEPESTTEEMLESPSDEMDEMLENCNSPEEIDALMKKLMEKKLALKAQGE